MADDRKTYFADVTVVSAEDKEWKNGPGVNVAATKADGKKIYFNVPGRLTGWEAFKTPGFKAKIEFSISERRKDDGSLAETRWVEGWVPAGGSPAASGGGAVESGSPVQRESIERWESLTLGMETVKLYCEQHEKKLSYNEIIDHVKRAAGAYYAFFNDKAALEEMKAKAAEVGLTDPAPGPAASTEGLEDEDIPF